MYLLLLYYKNNITLIDHFIRLSFLLVFSNLYWGNGGGTMGKRWWNDWETMGKQLLSYCLAIVLQLLRYCLTIVLLLLNYCLAIVTIPFRYCSTIVFLLLNYCLTTACQLESIISPIFKSIDLTTIIYRQEIKDA